MRLERVATWVVLLCVVGAGLEACPERAGRNFAYGYPTPGLVHELELVDWHPKAVLPLRRGEPVPEGVPSEPYLWHVDIPDEVG